MTAGQADLNQHYLNSNQMSLMCQACGDHVVNNPFVTHLKPACDRFVTLGRYPDKCTLPYERIVP